METKQEERQWSGKTDGTPFMQRSLVVMMRYVNIRVFYGIMALVVPFYMLFSHKGYLAAYHFFRQRLGYGAFKSFVNVYKNHFRFGQVIMDRFYAYAGRKFETEVEGRDIMEAHAAAGGVILLGSHVGNYEQAGYSLQVPDKSIHAVVFAGETETMMQNRSKVLATHNMGLIPIKEDMSHLFAINAQLESGGIVSMHADRLQGEAQSLECEFFGAAAKFPAGPFKLALRRKTPVLAVFAMKESTMKYRVMVYDITAAAAERNSRLTAQSLAQAFADRLEQVVRKYPCQWFNYYEFWQQ